MYKWISYTSIQAVRETLSRGHGAPVCLYHGSSDPNGLYMVDQLRALKSEYGNFRYVAYPSRGDITHGMESGRADEAALDRHRDLSDWRIYPYGHPETVTNTRKKAFLAGAAFAAIHADPSSSHIDSSPSGLETSNPAARHR